MSMKDLKQDRRQWLKASATILGAAALPLPALGELQVPPAANAPLPTTTTTAKLARFFTPTQHAFVDELTETIIPADSHSGGAKAAKVVDVIEKDLRETLDDDRRALWREGLRLIELMTEHYHGKSFVECTPEQRIEVLTVLSDHEHMTELPEVRLFHDLKRSTVEAYYTSKIGIHDELEYKGNRILQEFVGCDDPTPSST